MDIAPESFHVWEEDAAAAQAVDAAAEKLRKLGASSS
jgi:hypothetical protein